jgi:hypothetical protein
MYYITNHNFLKRKPDIKSFNNVMYYMGQFGETRMHSI